MLAAARRRAIELAGTATVMHHISGVGGHTASRSPIFWPIYLFSPKESGCMICDGKLRSLRVQECLNTDRERDPFLFESQSASPAVAEKPLPSVVLGLG